MNSKALPKEPTLLEQVQEVIPSCVASNIVFHTEAMDIHDPDYLIAWLVKHPPQNQRLDTLEHFQLLINEYWADAPQGYLRMFGDWQGESVRAVVARITNDRMQWARIDHRQQNRGPEVQANRQKFNSKHRLHSDSREEIDSR